MPGRRPRAAAASISGAAADLKPALGDASRAADARAAMAASSDAIAALMPMGARTTLPEADNSAAGVYLAPSNPSVVANSRDRVTLVAFVPISSGDTKMPLGAAS